jgi:hypothetical protein
MKKYILFILFYFLICNLGFSQTNTLSEARRLIQLQKQELINAKEENKKLSSSLNDANTKLTESSNHLLEVQIAADSLKQWGVDQQKQSWNNFNAMLNEKKEKEKQIELKEKAIKKYHFCKLINAIIASILGLVLGLNFMKYVPPTHTHYAFALPLLGIISGFLLVWFIL